MKDIIIYLEKLLSNNQVVVVATSGGPDSMCLLNLLCKFDVKIVVAHVNHKLRSESEEEAEFVKSFALDKGLIYEYMEIKEYNHDNLENEARVKRYAFFNELICKYNANYLMTAHHADDLMETILMRIVRGSSLKGYSGFKKEIDMNNFKLVRPLITLTKSEILEYMDNNHLKYFIDKSNYSRDYTRNRYRLDCLPFLKSEDKNVHLKFLKFSEELDKANSFINSFVLKIIDDLKLNDGLSISKLKELDSFLLQRVIEYELSLWYPNDLFLISGKHTDLIINLVKSDKSNLRVNLPNKIVAVKEYDVLKFINGKVSNEFYYELNDTIYVPNGIIKKINNSDSKSNYVIRLNSKDIELPLIVRSRRDGDKMEVKNLKGSKKVKDILIDSKVPILKRNDIPIVTDSKNRILWVTGVKKSKFDVESNGIYDIILLYEEE
jgi:tRNA(Ile)-lysidine synthetase-like protein